MAGDGFNNRALRLSWADTQGAVHTRDEALHISFAIRRQLGSVPGKMIMSAFQAPDEVEAGLLSAQSVTLSLGNGQMLFNADYVNAWVEKQENQRVVCLDAMDGDTLMHASVSLSLKRGLSMQSALNALCGANAPVIQNDRILPRGQVYNGKLMEALEDMAASTGAAIAIQNGQARFVYPEYTSVTAISKDDLLGEITPFDTGILFNTPPRSFVLGECVSIEGAVYRIIAFDIVGDTRSGPWQTLVRAVSNERISALNGAVWS